MNEWVLAAGGGVTSNLQGLRASGVGLATDDFGAGVSSLNSLSRFPVDWLKIDRGFIDGALGVRDVALLEALVRLGRSLGMATVAEGLETPEQRSCARYVGFDLGQGYLVSRPVPVSGIDATVDNLRMESIL